VGISRAQAVSYLNGSYGIGTYNLLDQADLLHTDTTGGLKEPIDRAVLALTGDWDLLADDITGTRANAYFAALDYFMLDRIILGLDRLATIDIAVGEGVSLKGSQVVERLQARFAAARELCRQNGVVVDGLGGLSDGPIVYNLGWLDSGEEMEI
jgi:hypothetical protein